ncbi:Kelch repeat-containing protein [Flavobacterium hibernum]|uniref:Galactose oxidase n=1 Tax=Flavobacterium hibernum TaxID=37752 RepID=A0A0D0EEQ7_9FLAO|nr:carboxypeptidase-like regulatory domain-containing protein [Flavobacterium hibernum]KIO52774.1 galactose oxidase [Flavobacterium hibernum]OXA83940.1 galactose oxidase [Flavobacterium hibernum]STO15467.1 TonB-linked outer membrane protein, SusC/RagA family [Flavobacterium hibernum]
MKKLLLFFVLCPLLSIAQNINGSVVSQRNNLPVENTNIYALSSKVGTITNQDGQFSLKLLTKFKDDEILEFSHIGYITARFTLNYLTKHNYKIFLEEEVQNLSGVTITATKKLKLKLGFKQLNSMKSPISAFGSFLKDDKMYLVGGDASYETDLFEKYRAERADADLFNFLKVGNDAYVQFYKRDLCIYDFKTDTWELQKLDLEKRAYHNIHFYDNAIYILGGKKILINKSTTWEYIQDKIEVLNLTNQSIQIDKTNPHQAANFASFSYKDNIIVMGGYLRTAENGVKDFTSKIHLYNITSGYWYEFGNLPTPRETTGVMIGDQIYLIGGNDGKPITKIQSFDINTQIWQTEAELFSDFERPAITHHDDIIYFFENQKMCTYNLKTKQLKEYEIELGYKYSTMYFYNHKLYIFGGRTENEYSKISSSKVFSVDIGEFKNTIPTRTKTFFQEINLAKAD